MLGHLINRYVTPLYVQLWATKIRVTELRSGRVFEDEPLLIKDRNSQAVLGIGRATLNSSGANAEAINPFSHPRLLLADFQGAQLLLGQALKTLMPNRRLAPSPFVIIQAMEKTEGGLTQVERRAFLELAMGIGAYDARVYEGDPLVAGNFDLATFKTATPKG